MSEQIPTEVKQAFNAAFRVLASARASYEDEPRDPQRIAALGAARIALEDARSGMDVARRRLSLDPPWKLEPGAVDQVHAPPLWSISPGPSA